MDRLEKCETCKWWFRSYFNGDDGTPKKSNWGQCRRAPPSTFWEIPYNDGVVMLGDRGHIQWDWPQTQPWTFCGMYKLREGKAVYCSKCKHAPCLCSAEESK